ncbi:MAG: 2-hydroxychromene-2-carboxylate isomerase [Betaproteobacteria bacterium]|jgi:2-hydroxychromene-2-carboxylate isomerase|nr:MAG: 2-hydroxychromene-2-carboxylate isomerase [Betaproteobacteria bacterium]
MKAAEWYFDFISPYAYLQSTRLDELAKHVQLRPRPVLFAGLLNHYGNLGPAEIPPKRQFVFRQTLWLAQRHGIAMRLPPAHPFNPLPPLRLALVLGCGIEAVQAIFNFIWRDGGNTDNPEDWKTLAQLTGVDPNDERLSDTSIKQALRDSTEAAIEAGVFGIPTLVVDNELFWGHDTADFFLDYLKDPDAIRKDIFEPVNQLAQGAAKRKRPA